MLVVVAAVIIVAGRVLISQRKPGTHLAGAWELPGGKVEADEDPRDALMRSSRRSLVSSRRFTTLSTSPSIGIQPKMSSSSSTKSH